jgi:hypothetical protein
MDAIRPAIENAGRAEQQQDRHRPEQHEVGELRQQPTAIGVKEPDDDAAENRALEAAQAADDHHHQCQHQNVPFRARVQREERTADDAGDAGEERGERRDEDEQPVDIDADRIDDLAIVDAGAHHRADLRLLVEQPQRQRGECAEQDEREAQARIVDVARQDDRAAQIGRGRNLEIVAAPDRQAHLADDESHTHGQQHLGQVIAADRPDQEAVDEIAQHHDGQPANHKRQFKAAGNADDGQADIAAQQVIRAVGHVDHAHQAERQREPAGQQEQQCRERDAVDGLENGGSRHCRTVWSHGT